MRVKYEERDLFKYSDFIGELKYRLNSNQVQLPVVFLNGQICISGDAVSVPINIYSMLYES
jgi:hypothetical protein